MPELPDVEIFKQYLDSTSLHKNIEKVEILAPEMIKEIDRCNIRIGSATFAAEMYFCAYA